MQTAEARKENNVRQNIAILNTNIVRGDNSGAENIYAWRGPNGIYTSPSIAALMAAAQENGPALEIDRDSIVYLLHNSLVPTPKTVFKGVYVLGVGDRLEFDRQKIPPTAASQLNRRGAGMCMARSRARLLGLLMWSDFGAY